MNEKRGKLNKLIWEIDGIQLWVQLRQYIVIVPGTGLKHYCFGLEDALEDILDLYERKQVSKSVWRTAEALLKEIERIHVKFWEKVEEIRKTK